jgi:hypothetical protein
MRYRYDMQFQHLQFRSVLRQDQWSADCTRALSTCNRHAVQRAGERFQGILRQYVAKKLAAFSGL